MLAPDLEAQESALTALIRSLQNTAVVPAEPLVREVFNLLDEANSNNDTPRRMPCVGILHEGEEYDPNRLLGGFVSQSGHNRWSLVVLCDSAARDGGIRGKRGAYSITKQLMQGIDGADLTGSGDLLTANRRRRFNAHNEHGELIPVAGYVVEVSHPIVLEQ